MACYTTHLSYQIRTCTIPILKMLQSRAKKETKKTKRESERERERERETAEVKKKL